MRRICICLFIFFPLLLSAGINSDNLRFFHITSDDGLSQSEVYSFLKDSQGFMWFGTVHGLNMYDGYDITRFMADNTDFSALVNNTVRDLAEDSYGRVWVATDNGLDYFNRSTRSFIHVPLPSDITPVCAGALLMEGDTLYVGTNVSLYTLRLSSDGIEETDVYPVDGLNGEHRVTEILKTKKGVLYLGTTVGLRSFSIGSGGQVHVNPLPDVFHDVETKSIAQLDSERLLLGSLDRLAVYDITDGTYYVSDINIGTISTILPDGRGNIWVGTNYDGLFKMSIEENRLRIVSHYSRGSSSYGLSSDLVTSLYLSDNMLWVGTIGNGVDFANIVDRGFHYIDIPSAIGEDRISTSFVRSVYASQDKVYIGLHSNGLIIYDRSTSEYSRIGLGYKPAFYITDFLDDSLLLCAGDGLHVLGNSGGDMRKIPGIDYACFYAETDGMGHFWIATYYGLYRMDTTSGWPYEISKVDFAGQHTQHSNNCRVLKYDRQSSRLWVGTEGGGLFSIDIDTDGNAGNVHAFTDTGVSDHISNAFVRSLYLDPENRLWVGTYDGLNVLEPDGDSYRIRENYCRHYLHNNVIQSIAGDVFGNVWVGTNLGLVNIPPQGRPVVYTVQDGLQSNEFSEHAVSVSETGEMFFGGIAGISYFNPKNLSFSSLFPIVTFTEFTIQNWKTKHERVVYSVRPDDTIWLNPKEKEFQIKFSAMVFDTPGKIRYRYRLDGYDSDWKTAENGDRFVRYTNLSPGKYTFRIFATNRDGVWGNNPASFRIIIKTPLLLRVPFLILYVLVFFSAILTGMYFSVERKTARKTLELENEHNKRLHQLDLLRTRFFVNISHDLRTPLTLIIGPLEQINGKENNPEYVREKVSQAYRSAKKLKFMVEQLLDFRKVETGKEKLHLNRIEINKWISEEISYFAPSIKEKGLELRMNLGLQRVELMLDVQKVSKILFNLMSNAIKFTSKGYIMVSSYIDRENSMLRICVADSGKGIDSGIIGKIFERFFTEADVEGLEGYGIGLSYCRDLALAMDGNLSVSSELGKGSEFELSVPLVMADDGAVHGKVEDTGVVDLVVGQSHVEDFVQEYDKEKKTVLVVDDNHEMRNYIAEILGDIYNVVLASSGQDALEKVDDANPDIIVSDVMMPGMTGIQLTELIKSDMEISHIPIILLTAKTEIDTMVSGLKNGADDYIIKPFDTQVLLARIQSVLANRERIKRAFRKDYSLNVVSSEIPDADTEFINKVMSLIEQNIDNPEFTIDSLEKDMFMSHSKFFRKLKALTGMSGKELLQDVRLKKATVLLENSKLSISDIAYKTGFMDAKYFSYAFKQKYGLSPSGYREGTGGRS